MSASKYFEKHTTSRQKYLEKHLQKHTTSRQKYLQKHLQKHTTSRQSSTEERSQSCSNAPGSINDRCHCRERLAWSLNITNSLSIELNIINIIIMVIDSWMNKLIKLPRCIRTSRVHFKKYKQKNTLKKIKTYSIEMADITLLERKALLLRLKVGGQGTILRVGCYAAMSQSPPHPIPSRMSLVTSHFF